MYLRKYIRPIFHIFKWIGQICNVLMLEAIVLFHDQLRDVKEGLPGFIILAPLYIHFLLICIIFCTYFALVPNSLLKIETCMFLCARHGKHTRHYLKVEKMNLSKLHTFKPLHKGAICQFLVRWIYYRHASESTGKKNAPLCTALLGLPGQPPGRNL